MPVSIADHRLGCVLAVPYPLLSVLAISARHDERYAALLGLCGRKGLRVRGLHSFTGWRRLRAPLGTAAVIALAGGALLIGPADMAAQAQSSPSSPATTTTLTSVWTEAISSTSTAGNGNPNSFLDLNCAGQPRNQPNSTSAPVTLAADGHNSIDPMLSMYFQFVQKKAREDGVELKIVDGCRTFAQQQKLWNDAVAEAKKSGKNQQQAEDAARMRVARWEDNASVSRHLYGRAIDVGPESAYKWIEDNIKPNAASVWPICRIYANEVWHLELAPNVRPQDGLPLNMYPTDPRAPGYRADMAGKPVNGLTPEGKPKIVCPEMLPDARAVRKDL